MCPIHYFKILSSSRQDGNIEIKIGTYYLAANKWGNAIQAFKKGIEKGDLTAPQEAVDLLATACLGAGITHNLAVEFKNKNASKIESSLQLRNEEIIGCMNA